MAGFDSKPSVAKNAQYRCVCYGRSSQAGGGADFAHQIQFEENRGILPSLDQPGDAAKN
ncbi:hypothetical protein D3C78_839270 [compost metagenome]